MNGVGMPGLGPQRGGTMGQNNTLNRPNQSQTLRIRIHETLRRQPISPGWQATLDTNLRVSMISQL